MAFLFRNATSPTEALAADLHERWREQYRKSHGALPKLKQTSDRNWSARHGGKNIVDIANTPFQDLPVDWQRDNFEAAEAALSMVKDRASRGEPFDNQFIENASAILHERWRERAGPTASPELQVPFGELPRDEREKDRAQIVAAIKIHRDRRRWWHIF